MATVLTVAASIFVIIIVAVAVATVVAIVAYRLDIVVKEAIGLGDRRSRLVLLWRV
jgi:hypothetical protein